jgi:hypothetical protein
MRTIIIFLILFCNSIVACECIRIPDAFLEDIKLTDRLFVGNVISKDTAQWERASFGNIKVFITQDIINSFSSDTTLISGGCGKDCIVPVASLCVGTTYLFKAENMQNKKMNHLILNGCRISYLIVENDSVSIGIDSLGNVRKNIEEFEKQILHKFDSLKLLNAKKRGSNRHLKR